MANLDGKTSSDNFFYDVFLSFRGDGGTRYGFTDHLYDAMRQKGIYTFRDDEELKIGADIRPALFKAIENSRMLMVVLCQNYASSTWCLDELAKIIDCYDNINGKHVLIVFYKVEPLDVSSLKNSYGDAIIEHEKRFGKGSENVEKWKNALSRVTELPYLHCGHERYEPELIKKIVTDTSAKLPPIPLPMKHLVGLDAPFEIVKPLLDIESRDTIHMLEIYGGGGIGKTTFALDIYNKIRHQFEAASFLANVREKSENSAKGLEDLQKTLLSEMGEETQTMMGSIFTGGFGIKRRLGQNKVLLVLDDVDSIKQLEALAGAGDWFGSGSRIIVTTRDTALVDKHVMDGVIIQKYEMKELNDSDSLELFSWHAFYMSKPAEKFESVAIQALNYAKGIPLALKVMGSNLKGGSLKDWEVEIEKYKNIPNAEIQEVLEISYISLFELDQKTFLDIACFFKGERWEYVERILKASDFFPNIRPFVMKSLINVDENGCLDMHDLIQGMGREVVRKVSPLNLGDRSRLWSHKDVLQVLKENLGSTTIEGIVLDPPNHEDGLHCVDTAFEKMENLRILIIRNTTFSKAPAYLPNSLRLLDWKGYPSKSFPPGFYPQRIVDFKLPYSSLMLEKPFQIFEDLTFIKLSQCQSITQIPNLSGAKNLRTLTLDKCHKLVRFDESIGFMPNLVYLSASDCTMLRSFVPRMYLPSLEFLSFNLCKRLGDFPDVMQKMEKPLKIFMIDTAVKKFPNSVSYLTGLEYIDMSNCKRLSDLSCSLLLLPKLVTLIIDGCSQLGKSFISFKKNQSLANGNSKLVTLCISDANLSDEDICIILQSFPKLEALNVSHNNFASLPIGIKGSVHLKSLDVSYCRNLMEIAELPLTIQKMDARYCGSLSSKASSMLWSQVRKEKERIQVVMPKKKIPNWFDYVHIEDIPFFWARKKFPIVALVFEFGEVKEEYAIKEDTLAASEFLPGIMSDKSYGVNLSLFIGDKEICSKDYYYNCSVGEHHVLLCDLRTLFNDEEWQGLDSYLGDDWKAIQVQLDSLLTLSRWGVYIYKQKTNIDDIIIFKPPNCNLSRDYIAMPTLSSVAKKIPLMQKSNMIASMSPREIFGEYLPYLESDETPSFSAALLRLWRTHKANMTGEASASGYGASLKQEHEDSGWDVVRIVELAMGNVPKDFADSYPEAMQITQQILEQFFRAREDFMREKGRDSLDIDMPIILEAYHTGEALSRRYWGKLVIKHGDPTFKAVLRKTSQLAWKLRNNKLTNNRLNIVLLKCQQRPYMEASSSSSGNAESFEDEEYYDPVLEELLSRIAEDSMSYNKSHGMLTASIVLTENPVSDKYLFEGLIMRGQENMAEGNSELGNFEMRLSMFFMMQPGMMAGFEMEGMGFNFKETPYGKLKAEDETENQNQNQPESSMRHGRRQSVLLNQMQHDDGLRDVHNNTLNNVTGLIEDLMTWVRMQNELEVQQLMLEMQCELMDDTWLNHMLHEMRDADNMSPFQAFMRWILGCCNPE